MHGLVTFVAQDLIIISFLAVPFLFFKLPRSQRTSYVLFFATSLVATALLFNLAQSVYENPRPFNSDGVVAYFTSELGNGFPSLHTVMSAFCALIVIRYRRQAGIGLVILSACIGWARVVGNVHHAIDIVAGLAVATLGVGIGYLLTKSK